MKFWSNLYNTLRKRKKDDYKKMQWSNCRKNRKCRRCEFDSRDSLPSVFRFGNLCDEKHGHEHLHLR
jgi:hypothetical protein